ncbi:PREDICTED: vegetative cell wall protein gp1-like [Nipponia nippon]|uniref:vegetative cell wall protein gp1-like n=1 Tax=Nipponia nippon TaxID=128390 RepID=UPI000510ABDC|nr:PREDICTED: vegetative cell wall protein gp1-like [Nipponia nippon]
MAPISPSGAPEPTGPSPAGVWNCPEDPPSPAASTAPSPAAGGTPGPAPSEGCRAPGAPPAPPRALGLSGSEMEDAATTPRAEAEPDGDPAPGS